MPSTAARKKPSRTRRILTRILLGSLALLGLAMAAFLVWASVGIMAGEPGPLSEVADDPAVTLTDLPEAIVLRPADGASAKGFVFIPGAKVEADAYVSNLSGIVEQDGITVVITKPTLHLALLDLRPLSTFTDLAPDVAQWVVGGHSLGGVKACLLADDPKVSGLVLFGSYCANDLSQTSLPVLSIGGSQDALSTPTKIEEASTNVPATAEFVQVDGANHARFGDYGVQSGDGTATIASDAMRDVLTENLGHFLAAN